MPAPEFGREFRHAWLPHVTDAGLGRLIELLAAGSPLLIHGSFSGAMPQGCPATHAAWHHPRTRHLMDEAGVIWLTRVARLNPGTSAVLGAWDDPRACRWAVRDDLLALCQDERERRANADTRHLRPAGCGV